MRKLKKSVTWVLIFLQELLAIYICFGIKNIKFALLMIIVWAIIVTFLIVHGNVD